MPKYSADDSVVRLGPNYYIHVLNSNTNVSRIEIGPQTFTKQEHEKVVVSPTKMINIPPRCYCTIYNPVIADEAGKATQDEHGIYMVRHGATEVRLPEQYKEPFPLYPGESLQTSVRNLEVIPANTAFRIQAVEDCVVNGEDKVAGDEWLLYGPKTYIPQVTEKKLETISSIVIRNNTALRLRARRDCKSRDGAERKAGEEWIERKAGAFLPGVDEVIVGTLIEAKVLTDKKALQLRALKSFTDVYGHARKAGEEWLVTNSDAETHITDVQEHLVSEVRITTLSNRQFCIVGDYVDEKGVQRFGEKLLRKGEVSFFLKPGERLVGGIQNIYVLGEEEALLLRATETYDGHEPGDKWLVNGPTDFTPPVEVEVVENRRMIPLDDNEGIYVRDLKSGTVRLIRGQSYMIKPYEQLWEKVLPQAVEDILSKDLDPSADRLAMSQAQAKTKSKARDKTRAVTYRCPHNSAVQVYDYKEQKARVVFGPELVMLNPDEQFTMLNLSGDKPKKPGVIKSLCLLLGPDFMTDIVLVETSDHARLKLQLSYNWYFDVDPSVPEHASQVFQVPDFIGDACKAIASRVRGAVASESFDNFHQHQSKIIRQAVFGIDKDSNKIREHFRMPTNRLVITNIDIQSSSPVDPRTSDSLQKSVQLAIEITTSSQEAQARHEAERIEQEAKGRLERQKIADEANAEKQRTELLKLQAETASIETTGQATAEAKARAESSEIEGKASVEMAKLKAQAMLIECNATLEQLKAKQEQEVDHIQALDNLEIEKSKKLADIESEKFEETIGAIGKDTIKSIAQAGPEMQAKLLKGLGLKGFLVTDGNSPINLFNTASGLVGNMPQN